MSQSQKNPSEEYFSRCCVLDEVPIWGHKCQFCGEPLRKGARAYKFARIEGRSIEYAYTHMICTDNKLDGKSDLTDEQIRRVWEGVERLMK